VHVRRQTRGPWPDCHSAIGTQSGGCSHRRTWLPSV